MEVRGIGNPIELSIDQRQQEKEKPRINITTKSTKKKINESKALGISGYKRVIEKPSFSMRWLLQRIALIEYLR